MARLEPSVELFGTSDCPYTADARERLEWDGVAFTEYDVEHDLEARQRLLGLTGGNGMIPVLVKDGRVAEIGWRGRGCYVDAGSVREGRPCAR